ncbi:hypothetical protein PQR62_23785 [Herbaspirillum lusitanum]|uniref:Uncharacterized protein n=1 Tax=Herbaspirillum lusitanum TaxID=213312 RepID=A0ABW9AGT5_9BURK
MNHFMSGSKRSKRSLHQCPEMPFHKGFRGCEPEDAPPFHAPFLLPRRAHFDNKKRAATSGAARFYAALRP